MRLKDGPLPMPPPGVGPPPPGLLLQRPPPPLLPGMMPPPPGALFPPPAHLFPPHLAAGAGLAPMSEPTPEVRQEAKQEVKKEVNFSKLQLPRIPDNVQVSVTVLPPKRMATQLPPRPVVVKSETVTIAPPPRKDDSPEKDVKVVPKMEADEAQQLLKQETFQVQPFEPSADRPGIDGTMLPSRTLLEQTFERILDSEQLISVPGATGRKMLEAVNHQQSEQNSGAMALFDHGGAGDRPSKVVTKGDWMTIVSRLLTRAFARDSESSSSSSNAGSSNQGMKERMIEYICKDFKQRRELALTWLHEEWYYDEMLRRQGVDMDDREPQYLWCLYKILDGITSGETQLDAKDRGLTRFLLEVPELPEGAVDVIQRYCDDSARAQIGMSCLRDIVNLRPPSRPQALKILLSYTAHPEKMQRSMAIVTAKKWYLEHPTVGPEVKEYALAQLEMLKDYPVPKRDSTTQQIAQAPSGEPAGMTMEGVEPTLAQPPRENTEATIKTEVINERPTSHGTIKEPSTVSSGNSSAPTSVAATATAEQVFVEAEEDIGRLLELYFSLCAKDHSLLEVLFAHYSSFDPFVQRVIRQKIQPLIKSIKSDSTKLLALIRDFPKGAEMLVLRIIFILTDGVHPSPGLVNAVQQAVVQHDLNARFLIPIISGLDKTQIMANLPRIVSLLKGTERERRTVTDVFLKLLTASGGLSQPFNQSSSIQTRGGPVLMPAELLIELHVMEDTVGWKAACEAMDICFNHPEIYKSEIIAVVLQRLLDLPTIPSLFMRTVIQAITLYKNLVGFVNTMVLAKLIPKQIWTRPVLWKGFVRCAKMMLPTSCSVLASLPKPQLKEVMAMEPSIKEPFEAYIKEIKSSGRRVGGGAAKQVNVLNAARSGSASNAAAVVPPRPTVAEDGDVIKKEQDLDADQTMSAIVKSEPADASMKSEGLV
ncbi:Symplekin tight junction protein C terminal-domain-containing protein [Dissophora ornata]|nr:Symplekin tight junction protein C terminal-domain-containing protein [Dissophora ornata]